MDPENELIADMKKCRAEVKTWPSWEQNSMKAGEFSTKLDLEEEDKSEVAKR